MLLAGCSCGPEKPEADAARADRRRRSPRARPGTSASAASQFPLTVGGQRRRRSRVGASDGSVARARGRQRPRRSGAPTSAPSSRPASAATAASPRSSRATASWSRSRPARSSGRKPLGVARRDGAAGRRRARLRARRRPRGAGLRRARRPQALEAAAPRRSADAGADRRASPRSRTPWSSARARAWPASIRCAATLRWEVPIGSPRGTNEVERLADLVGPLLRVGDAALRALVPGGGRLRRRASAARSPGRKNVGGTDAVGGDAELRVRRRRVATASPPGARPAATSPGPPKRSCTAA